MNNGHVKEKILGSFQELEELSNLLTQRELEVHHLKEENSYLKNYIDSQDLMFRKTIENNEIILKETAHQKEELEEKNEEISRQKEILESMLAELQETHDEMEMQKNYLEETIKELDKINTDVTASIKYAQRIQNSIIPPLYHLKQYISDCFVFFKPKDLVSGDFYWYSIHGHKIIIAAVDCTGHGVPGALMSIIGLGLLNKVVNVLKIFSPEKILYALNLGINDMLNQYETRNKDGMDIALCVIDTDNGILEYAGAHNPLIVIQNNKLRKLLEPNLLGSFPPPNWS